MSGDIVLAKIDSARDYLEQAKSIMEVKEVIALADALQTYTKRVKASQEAINYANEIRLRAERKLGQMLEQRDKNKGGRPEKTGRKKLPVNYITPTLAEQGLDKYISSRSKLLAKTSDAEFEATLHNKPEINANRIIKDIREKHQSDTRTAKRTEAANRVEILDTRIIVGDFRSNSDKVVDGSLSLIFTDPPYDQKSISLLEGLASFAEAKLAEGGSLLCYVGHLQLAAALNAFHAKLRYWWTICCLHSGGNSLMREYGIRVGWKPILWFVKGTRHDKDKIVLDVVSGGKEKSDHEWQQAQSEAAYWIEQLTEKNDLVCDPFLGSGTTAVAAKKLQRQWIGFEIDPATAAIAGEKVA